MPICDVALDVFCYLNIFLWLCLVMFSRVGVCTLVHWVTRKWGSLALSRDPPLSQQSDSECMSCISVTVPRFLSPSIFHFLFLKYHSIDTVIQHNIHNQSLNLHVLGWWHWSHQPCLRWEDPLTPYWNHGVKRWGCGGAYKNNLCRGTCRGLYTTDHIVVMCLH